MSEWGTEFHRRPTGVLVAPEKVRAVQYKTGSGFQEKYVFLKFVAQGLGITIYADGVVAKTDQGNVRILDSDWILKDGEHWYFLKDDVFQANYEKVA